MSVWNGVYRFCHPQKSLPIEFAQYAVHVLDYYYPLLKLHSQERDQNFIIAKLRDPEHSDKAAGYPCNNMGASTKVAALDKFGLERLVEMYADCSMIGSTLKNEVRPEGKDARFFRPCDVSTYCEALRLFDDQNEYLADNLFSHPIFIKFATPGTDLGDMYGRLLNHGGKFNHFDGSAWDANFSLAIAEILCYWRARDHPSPNAVVEYYSRMYNGYTSVYGNMFHLIGQPSGHLLTSTDNSL